MSDSLLNVFPWMTMMAMMMMTVLLVVVLCSFFAWPNAANNDCECVCVCVWYLFWFNIQMKILSRIAQYCTNKRYIFCRFHFCLCYCSICVTLECSTRCTSLISFSYFCEYARTHMVCLFEWDKQKNGLTLIQLNIVWREKMVFLLITNGNLDEKLMIAHT